LVFAFFLPTNVYLMIGSLLQANDAESLRVTPLDLAPIVGVGLMQSLFHARIAPRLVALFGP